MRPKLFVFILCATLTGALFGQESRVPAAQSISFTSGDAWVPGATVTLDVFLTFSGYSSYGLSYWLEVPATLAPHISITGIQYFTFPDPNSSGPFPILFNSLGGARPGYMSETRDLGATVQVPTPGNAVPPGTYHITQLTFSLAPSLPAGTFTMYSTSNSPLVSEVVDTSFNDNNIVPPGSFVIVVPEPSTFVLLGFGASFLGACAIQLRGWSRRHGRLRL